MLMEVKGDTIHSHFQNLKSFFANLLLTFNIFSSFFSLSVCGSIGQFCLFPYWSRSICPSVSLTPELLQVPDCRGVPQLLLERLLS